jgi:hypothetical protein
MVDGEWLMVNGEGEKGGRFLFISHAPFPIHHVCLNPARENS